MSQPRPGLILAHQNYVKNVIFPLEMLPAVMATSALLTLAATLSVILLLQETLGSGLSWTVLLLPVLVLPLLLFALGLSWFLAALGVYIRDIQQLIVPLVQLLMFMSPVFYPVSAPPEAVRYWFQFNPAGVDDRTDSGIILFNQSPAWMSLPVLPGRGIVGGVAGRLLVCPNSQGIRRCPLEPVSDRSTEEQAVIEVNEVGKCYQIYEKPQDRLKQMLWRGRRRYYHEFWALRNISFTVQRGQTVSDRPERLR